MASVSIDITDNADDAEYESDFGVFDDAGVVVLAGHTSVKAVDRTYAGGYRFLSVNVPQGTVVTSATLTLNISSVGGTPDVTVRGNDVDDASAWSDVTGQRPGDMGAVTTATVDSGVVSTGLKAIDVKTIIDEILARGSWLPNNAMRLDTVDNSGTGNNNFNTVALDGPGTEANLTIVFPVGAYIMPVFSIESVDYPGEPKVFQHRHSAGGSVLPLEEGFCGVMASLDGDASVIVAFKRLGGTLPSGSPYISLLARADGMSSDEIAQVQLEWAAVAAGEDPSIASLNDEGTLPLTWGATDDNKYKSLEWLLNAGTAPATRDTVIARFTFKTASWTLARVSMWKGWLDYH